MEVTKSPSAKLSDRKNCSDANLYVIYQESHSNLPGVTAAKLLQDLENKTIVNQRCKDFEKSGKRNGKYGSVTASLDIGDLRMLHCFFSKQLVYILTETSLWPVYSIKYVNWHWSHVQPWGLLSFWHCIYLSFILWTQQIENIIWKMHMASALLCFCGYIRYRPRMILLISFGVTLLALGRPWSIVIVMRLIS